MVLSRRNMLRNTALGAGVVAVGNVGALLTSSTALARPAGNGNGYDPGDPYGPLVPDPAGMLDLPEGFDYRVISRRGDALPDGVLPDAFDGMGAFGGRHKSIALVRNHEIYSPGLVAHPDFVYDPAAGGGTSNVHLDANGTKLAEYASLAGTLRNCAGGITPWGTWLTCEENEMRAGGVRSGVTYTKDHGYAFEVDPWNQDNNRDPQPLKALGRFSKEAAVLDPATLDVYVTEDASGPLGLMYKAVLDDPKRQYGGLRGTGALYAMAASLDGVHAPTLHPFSQIGTTLDVAWIEVPDPDATTVSTRLQFGDDQVTRSRKFEGLWWHGGKCYVVCSYAEGIHNGQVWSFDPLRNTLTLEVHFQVGLDESLYPNEPDNITISPWGGMILCEDGGGAQHLLTVHPDGSTTMFARNRVSATEFAGACFSPDRQTLFVNVYSPGLTYAITGPWSRTPGNGRGPRG